MSKRMTLLALSILLLACPKGMSSSSGFFSTSLVSRPAVANLRLGGSSQNKTVIYSDNDSVSFTQTVTTTSDVPNTATAKVDFLDFDNPGNVGYSVSARTQTKHLRGGGESTTYTFSLTTNARKIGTITMQFRLDSATDAAIVDPQTANVSVHVQSRDGG